MTATRIEPRDLTHEINGLRLHALDWGTDGKPPLVLVHGFSSHAHYWDGLSVKLRDERHVIALDQRGHGDSDWAGSYPPESMPDDLAHVVDALGLERFALLGHSMGGGVAMRYAAAHPQRIERLIIVDSGLPAADRPARPQNSVQRALAVDTFDDADAIVAHFQRLNPRAEADRIRRSIPYNFRARADGRLTFKFDPALRQRMATPEAVAAMRRSTEDLRGAVSRITCPMLLIRGETSDILSPEVAAETVAAFPHATLVEIPDAGHNVPTDNPVAFRQAVQRFLGLATAVGAAETAQV